jgi:hypothetical protein
MNKQTNKKRSQRKKYLKWKTKEVKTCIIGAPKEEKSKQ